MKRAGGTTNQFFYFQVRESLSPINIPVDSLGAISIPWEEEEGHVGSRIINSMILLVDF